MLDHNGKPFVAMPFEGHDGLFTIDTGNPGGGVATHNGEVYYFCGPGCRVAFEKDPEGYLSGEKSIEM